MSKAYKKTDGLVFDPDTGKPLSYDEAQRFSQDSGLPIGSADEYQQALNAYNAKNGIGKAVGPGAQEENQEGAPAAPGQNTATAQTPAEPQAAEGSAAKEREAAKQAKTDAARGASAAWKYDPVNKCVINLKTEEPDTSEDAVQWALSLGLPIRTPVPAPKPGTNQAVREAVTPANLAPGANPVTGKTPEITVATAQTPARAEDEEGEESYPEKFRKQEEQKRSDDTARLESQQAGQPARNEGIPPSAEGKDEQTFKAVSEAGGKVTAQTRQATNQAMGADKEVDTETRRLSEGYARILADASADGPTKNILNDRGIIPGDKTDLLLRNFDGFEIGKTEFERYGDVLGNEISAAFKSYFERNPEARLTGGRMLRINNIRNVFDTDKDLSAQYPVDRLAGMDDEELSAFEKQARGIFEKRAAEGLPNNVWRDMRAIAEQMIPEPPPPDEPPPEKTGGGFKPPEPDYKALRGLFISANIDAAMGRYGQGTTEADVNKTILAQNARTAEENRQEYYRHQQNIITQNAFKMQEEASALARKLEKIEDPAERRRLIDELFLSWDANEDYDPAGTKDPAVAQMRYQAQQQIRMQVISAASRQQAEQESAKKKTAFSNSVAALSARVQSGETSFNDAVAQFAAGFESVKDELTLAEEQSALLQMSSRLYGAAAQKFVSDKMKNTPDGSLIPAREAAAEFAGGEGSAMYFETLSMKPDMDDDMDTLLQASMNETSAAVLKQFQERNENVIREWQGRYVTAVKNGSTAWAAKFALDSRAKLEAAMQNGGVGDGFGWTTRDWFEPVVFKTAAGGGKILGGEIGKNAAEYAALVIQNIKNGGQNGEEEFDGSGYSMTITDAAAKLLKDWENSLPAGEALPENAHTVALRSVFDEVVKQSAKTEKEAAAASNSVTTIIDTFEIFGSDYKIENLSEKQREELAPVFDINGNKKIDTDTEKNNAIEALRNRTANELCRAIADNSLSLADAGKLADAGHGILAKAVSGLVQIRNAEKASAKWTVEDGKDIDAMNLSNKSVAGNLKAISSYTPDFLNSQSADAEDRAIAAQTLDVAVRYINSILDIPEDEIKAIRGREYEQITREAADKLLDVPLLSEREFLPWTYVSSEELLIAGIYEALKDKNIEKQTGAKLAADKNGGGAVISLAGGNVKLYEQNGKPVLTVGGQSFGLSGAGLFAPATLTAVASPLRKKKQEETPAGD